MKNTHGFIPIHYSCFSAVDPTTVPMVNHPIFFAGWIDKKNLPIIINHPPLSQVEPKCLSKCLLLGPCLSSCPAKMREAIPCHSANVKAINTENQMINPVFGRCALYQRYKPLWRVCVCVSVCVSVYIYMHILQVITWKIMAIMATVKFLWVLSKTGRSNLDVVWTCPRDQTLSPRIHRWEAGSPCRWNPGAPGLDDRDLGLEWSSKMKEICKVRKEIWISLELNSDWFR